MSEGKILPQAGGENPGGTAGDDKTRMATGVPLSKRSGWRLAVGGWSERHFHPSGVAQTNGKLWRDLFNLAVGNRDNHGRNMAVLKDVDGNGNPRISTLRALLRPFAFDVGVVRLAEDARRKAATPAS